jgi:hypothetical protein
MEWGWAVCPGSGAWCVVGMDGERAPLALGNGTGRTQANVEAERRRPLAGVPQTIYRTRKAVPSVALPRQLQVAERNFHCDFGSRVLWEAGMSVRWMLDAWMLGRSDASCRDGCWVCWGGCWGGCWDGRGLPGVVLFLCQANRPFLNRTISR